ncbi:MAG: hypothetical protein KKG25_14660 [Bacteroidetes bacterium]|nr:hypothetical protein [Bacteroidota bacterium]MBU2266962.1 hypothetical protein [Bacteroidota bacterium]
MRIQQKSELFIYCHSSSSNQFLGNPISLVCANGQVFINSLSLSLNVDPGLIILRMYEMQDNVA